MVLGLWMRQSLVIQATDAMEVAYQSSFAKFSPHFSEDPDHPCLSSASLIRLGPWWFLSHLPGQK